MTNDSRNLMRASGESIAFLEPYLVEKNAVWIVENVTKKAVVDLKSVSKVCSNEGCVADLASKLSLKRMDGCRERAGVDIVSNDKQVHLRFKLPHKEPGEHDEPWCAGATHRSHDILRAHCSRVADKSVELGKMLETGVHLEAGGGTDTLLTEEAGSYKVSKFAAYRVSTELRPLGDIVQRKTQSLIEDEEAEYLEAGWRAENLCERFHVVPVV